VRPLRNSPSQMLVPVACLTDNRDCQDCLGWLLCLTSWNASALELAVESSVCECYWLALSWTNVEECAGIHSLSMTNNLKGQRPWFCHW
jgi:hypothetical protein